MREYVIVPAGIIEDRVPRRLTEAEQAKVTKRNLNRLADKFAKPESNRIAPIVSKDNNGWKQ